MGVCTGELGYQERTSGSLGLVYWKVMSYPVCLLGNKLKSSARAASSHSQCGRLTSAPQRGLAAGRYWTVMTFVVNVYF